jgi:ABC-2 type transport system ATP-binding protein
VLSVRDLRKTYGDLIALDGVSFEVEKGDILGFLGPNGAGKSTTMKIVTGFIPATSGTALVDGLDVRTHSIEVRRRIGYLPENTPLYPEMRVREYLEFRARLKGVGRRDLAKRVDYALDRAKLADRTRQLIGTLSKGYRQRVGLADALVADPKLLVLDEPTIGLDPNQIREVRDLIKELGQQHTIILSTHILPEVEMVCSKVVIIAQGRSRLQGTVEGLVEQFHEPIVRVALRAGGASRGEVEQALLQVQGVKGIRPTKDKTDEALSFRLEIDATRTDAEAQQRSAAERIAARVVEKGWTLRELVPEKTTLEDVFVRVTLREEEPAAPEPALVGAASGNGSVEVKS